MKRVLALLAALLGLTLMVTPPVAAQETEAPASTLIVHRVDATSGSATAWAISSIYPASAGDVNIVEDGEAADVSSVNRASAVGVEQEVVFVVDSSQDLARGGILSVATTAVADAIRSLPAGTTVSVVDAGDSALVVVQPTTNLASAAVEVEQIELSTTSVMFNAIDRAGSLLSDSETSFKSVIIFSGSDDVESVADHAAARTGIIRAGAQVATVRYNGGESSLGNFASQAGGVDLQVTTSEEVSAAIAEAATLLSDRLVVTFASSTEGTERSNVTLTVADVSTTFGYAGGIVSNSVISLEPMPEAGEATSGFFGSATGLVVATGLTFAAIAIGIYALGSLFASGETSLDGLIDRYSGAGDGAALSDEDSATVQTALVQRAVELSETFAEDRGFLVKVEGMLERAKIPLRAGEAMSIYTAVILLSAAFGFLFFGGLLGFMVLGCVAAVAQIGVVNFKARRRMRKFEQQLPDTLQLLAGTLRAGYSLPQGLEAVSTESADPMGYELRRVMTEARLGRELEDALGSTAERLNSPDFAWAVMAIGIQREVGGNLNELLMTVSDTMIARERLKGEVAALTAEGKMSAILLGGLPPGLGVIMWVMNPLYMGKLFDTTLGNIFLGAGTLAALIGFAWMKKVITINV